MFVDFVGHPYPRIYVPQTFKEEMNCLALLCLKPVTQEITAPRTRKFWTIHKHWPQWISMIPQYPWVKNITSEVIIFGYKTSVMYTSPKSSIFFPTASWPWIAKNISLEGWLLVVSFLIHGHFNFFLYKIGYVNHFSSPHSNSPGWQQLSWPCHILLSI